MASYSAVIDLRVNGLQEIKQVEDRVKAIQNIQKQLKPIPSIFDRRDTEKVKKAKTELSEYVIAVGKGSKEGQVFSNTLAGINSQLRAFNTIAANAKVDTNEFRYSLVAAERASVSLAEAEAKRLQAQSTAYGAKTGVSVLVKDIIALQKVIPNSIAGLEFYERQLQDTLRVVAAGSDDYLTLARAIAEVNRQLAVAQGTGPMQGPALPPGFTERGRVSTGRQSGLGGGGGRRGGNILVGAAFPALFGAGPAGIVGGGVGEAFGPLGGVVGSALGNIVDEYVNATTALAESLSKPKEALEALEKAGYPVSDSLKRNVDKLLEAGKAYEAQQLVLQKINQTLGPDAVKQLSAYNQENEKLKQKFQEAKAELDKALLPALTGALKIVNDFVAGLKALANIKVPDWVENGLKFNLQINPVGQGILNARQGFNQLSGAGRRLAAAAPPPAAATPDPSVLERIQQDRQRQLEQSQKEYALQQEKLQSLEQELQYRTKLYDIQEKIGRAEEQGNNVLKVRLEGQARLVEEAEKGRQALQGLDTSQQKATQTQINNLNMFKVQADNARKVRMAQAQEDEKAKKRGEKLRADLQAKAKEMLEKDKQRMKIAKDLADMGKHNLNVGLTEIEQAKRLLELETQRFENSQRLQGARLSADLQVNNLEIQRAKRAGNLNRVYQLELKRARLVYQQTLQQIEAEVERAKLKQRQVQLAYQELRIENLKKAGKGKLTREDKLAEILAKDAVKMAAENVSVAKEIAEEQKRGALAVKQAAEETARYAYEQNKAAAATERTADAAERINRAMSGTYSSGSGGSASGSALRRNLAAGAKSTFKKLTTGMNLAEGGYVTRPTKALVGERGENEYVIPESKMRSSMERYARGARGEAVVEGNGSDNGMGLRTARGTTTVNVNTGPVVRMGNKDYVTVADLNNAVGSVVATLSRDTSNKYGTNPRIS